MRNKGEKKDLGKTKNKKILVEIATLNEEKCEKLKDRWIQTPRRVTFASQKLVRTKNEATS